MSDDRIERLERRVAVLEGLVRQMASQAGGAAVPAAGGGRDARPIITPAVPVAAAPAADASAAARPPVPPSPSVVREPEDGSAARAQQPPPPGAPRPISPAHATALTSEQWLGQRGLLAVGVVALILAAGYLLKLSFDRGWISPVMRCAGGVAAGVAVGAIGWRVQPRYRTYGAALIGCGAAIVYLSVWAASRLYGVLPPTTGIVGLALVSVALAMVAFAINVEALGTTAALGAFFAPVLLGRERAQADLLLLYLASMSVGLGMVAARQRWRLTTFVVAASFFGVGTLGAADRAAPWGVLLYGVLGGSVGLYLGLRERWWETRFLSFGGGWALLVAAADRLAAGWPVLLGALVLAAPVWWHALRSGPRWPLQAAAAAAQPAGSIGEALYFFLTPFLLGWALHQLEPAYFDDVPGLVPLLVAVPYLVTGYVRPRPAFALIGAAALGVAAWEQWDDAARVWALLALASLWAILDHRLSRTDGRWYSLLTLVAALHYLFDDALRHRIAADAAFVGPWALALWGAVAVTVALAAGLWRTPPDTGESRNVRFGLWALAGGMTLFGVTAEIRRYFSLRLMSAETASLASGLAVSAWWLVFAAALVVVGFRRTLRPARLAGLGVAGLAVAKVVLFDLSSLDALYRVASVLILGLVSLSLAYLYHRQTPTVASPAEEGRDAG